MIPEEDERHDDNGHQLEDASFNKERLQFVARRVVVKLAPKESIAALEESIENVVSGVEGAQALRPPSLTGRLVVVVPEGMSARDAVRSYASSDDVVYAEPDFVDTAQIVPNDPRYSMQWGPPLVGAEQAWDLETGAGNVVIGIVDSGISMTGAALDHDDLGRRSHHARHRLRRRRHAEGPPWPRHPRRRHRRRSSPTTPPGVAGMNWHSPMYIAATLRRERERLLGRLRRRRRRDHRLGAGPRSPCGHQLQRRRARQPDQAGCLSVRPDNGMLLCAAPETTTAAR